MRNKAKQKQKKEKKGMENLSVPSVGETGKHSSVWNLFDDGSLIHSGEPCICTCNVKTPCEGQMQKVRPRSGKGSLNESHMMFT